MVYLKDICVKASSSIAQKDLEGHEGQYPIYGAAGYIMDVDFYHQEKPYVAIVKDGAGVGRVMCLPAFSSVIGTLQYIIPTSDTNVHYLAYALEHMNLAKYYTGATIPHINFKDYCMEKLPRHSWQEQQSIATRLSKVDTLIALRKQQIAKLDELVKARFVEMFGDPKDNRFNWDTVSLGSLFSVGSSKRIYQNEQVPQGIPFLRISDLMERIEHGIDTAELFISKEKFDELQQDGLVPKCGDILVTSRGTLGRCYEIKSDDQFYFQDGMINWLSERSDRVNNTYIMNLFSMPGFRKQIDDVPAGSTVNYLSLARLKSLQVMCPPIDLQHQFAAFVAQTDQQKLTIQHSLAQLELLKKALMQKYFG